MDLAAVLVALAAVRVLYVVQATDAVASCCPSRRTTRPGRVAPGLLLARHSDSIGEKLAPAEARENHGRPFRDEWVWLGLMPC